MLRRHRGTRNRSCRESAPRHFQYRRALHGTAAQPLQRGIRVGEREWLHRRTKSQSSCEGDEGFAVGAGEIGDGSHRALAPEQAVREGGDLAHVNPGAHHAATGPHRAERGGDERTHWCEQNRRIEFLRGAFAGSASPHGAELTCEGLALVVAVAGEREYAPTLMPRDLRQEVCGGSKAVEAQIVRFPRLAI